MDIWIVETYLCIVLVLILIYSMKVISEHELKKGEKFYISIQFDKANDNTLQAEINRQERSIIKNYLMLE